MHYAIRLFLLLSSLLGYLTPTSAPAHLSTLSQATRIRIPIGDGPEESDPGTEAAELLVEPPAPADLERVP